MVKTCETLEYICNASQRLRILDILNGTQMGIRDLMDVLDSPRSTVQRNVSGLEKRGWVHRTASGYTTTTAGEILCENMVELNKAISKIRCLKPFFETVDAPPEMSINCLTDVVVTTPESGKPNAPTKRLFTAFKDADRVRGFIPVIADFAVKLFQNAERSAIDDEYIVPADVFDVLDEQYTSDWAIRIRLRAETA